MKKLPYIFVTVGIPKRVELWPYTEAQCLTIYEIPKSSCLYLTTNEANYIQEVIDNLQIS